MKKLIKLLFPKVYASILNEGYFTCQSEYNAYYYDDENDDFEYPENYFTEDLELEENELDEDYDDEHAQFLVDKHYVGDTELKIGDRIHLNSKNGMYTVSHLRINVFGYVTKKNPIPTFTGYGDYKCHAGGINRRYEGE